MKPVTQAEAARPEIATTPPFAGAALAPAANFSNPLAISCPGETTLRWADLRFFNDVRARSTTTRERRVLYVSVRTYVWFRPVNGDINGFDDGER